MSKTAMTYSDWRDYKKKNAANQIAQLSQQGTVNNGGTTANTTITYSDWRDYKKASQVDQNYIDSFFTDVKKFVYSSEEEYQGIRWKNASGIYKVKKTTADDLQSRSKNIRSWLELNKDKLEEDAYTNISSYLDSYDKSAKSILGAFEKARDHYAKWETEAEYKEAVKISELYNMSSEEIEPYLHPKRLEELEALYRKVSHNTDGTTHEAASSPSSSTSSSPSSSTTHEAASPPSSSSSSTSSTEPVAADKYSEELKKYGFKNKEELKKEIDSLKESSKIAYTTSDGQNITWQDLYDMKKSEEDFNALYSNLSSSKDWDEVIAKAKKYKNPSPSETEGWLQFNGEVIAGGTDKPINKVTYFEEHMVEIGVAELNGGGSGIVHTRMRELTDHEKDIYNYYFGKGEYAKADAFLDSLESTLQKRFEGTMLEGFVKMAEEYPVAASALSIVANMGAGAEYIGDAFKYISTGELDDNHSAAVVSAIRDTVAENINWEIAGWDAGAFVYNTGMSMADSLASQFLFGKFGGISLGLSAAASATNDALSRGMDNNQAFWSGLSAGVFEGLFESWSIGKFKSLQAGFSSSGKQIIKNIASSMLVNASEETLTEIANIAYDYFANGDFSQYETSIRAYMASGMSESKARSKVAGELAIQVGEAAGSGALMGLGFGGYAESSNAIGSTIKGKQIKNASKAGGLQIGDLVDIGKSLGEGTESYRLANKITDKSSAYAIGTLYGIEGIEISEANRADIIKSLERKGYDTATASSIADIMLDSKNDAFASVALQNPETFSDIILNPKSTVSQRTRAYDGVTQSVEAYQEAKKNGKKNAATEASIEKLAKEYEAKGLSPAEAKAMAETQLSQSGAVQSSPTAETAVESKYKVADDGKTTNIKTGKEVKVNKIESISSSGEANLTLDDGMIVNASDIAFSTPAEANFVSVISDIKIGKKPISTDSANLLYMAAMSELENNPNMTANDAVALIKGLEESYIFGAYNFGQSGLTAKSENGSSKLLAGELTQKQRDYAYGLGKKDSVAKVEAEQKTIDEKVGKAKTPASKKTSGKIVYEGGIKVDKKSLTPTQYAHLEGIKLLAELTNYEIHVFKSKKVGVKNGVPIFEYTMPDGTVRSANGWYVIGTNEFWIDLNAGNLGEGIMLETAGHEIGHDIKRKSPKQWKVIADLVMKTFAENNVDTEAMLKRQVEKVQRKYEASNKDMPSEAQILEEAYEEMVCDALSGMLIDGSIVNFIAEVKTKDKNLAQRILDAIKNLLAKWGLIIDDYKGRKLSAPEAQALAQFEDAFKQIQALYRDALMDTDAVNAALHADKAIELAEVGIGVDEVSGEVFALRDSFATNDKVTIGKKSFDIDAVAALVSEATGRSIEDARKWVNSEMTVANIVMRNPEFLDFEADDRYEAIKKNSDYPQGTVDLSNLCPKRSEFTSMFDMIQRKYRNKLFTAADVAEMRRILADNDITVACGACFVEDRRQLLGEIADTYINMWKEAVETGKPLHKTNAEGKKIKLTVTAALAKQYGVTKGSDILATDKYIPTQYDLTTYEGFKLLEKNHPTIAMGFNRYNNSRGQQSGRLIEGRAEYKRQILGWTDAKVKSVNNNGGLRIFSFSDFEVVHLLDLVQVIIDCSARGVKIQGYTKIPAFAKLVRSTGIKLNRSFIPKGETGIKVVDGKRVLDIDTTEGIDINDKNFLDESDNPDVGNVIIGINPEQIGIAFLDDNIDYIIPFHSNKAKAILKALGLESWVNYKESQHEKDIATGKASKHNVNIYTQVINKYNPTNKVEFVDAFLKECKRQGKIPRYAEFLNKEYNADGAYSDEGGRFDYTYREGYHKLLVDFKMFDKNGKLLPQGQITPTLDDAFMTELLNAEVDKKANYEFPQEVYDQIEEKFGGETMLSQRDSDGHKLSEEQIEFFKDSKIRDEKGRLLAVYHGTKSAGFTRFTKTDEIGYFFARSLKTAQTYSNNSKVVYTPDRYTDTAVPNEANYQVYLNIKKPYIIDGKGANWNGLESTGEKVHLSIKTSYWGDDGKGLGKIVFKYGGKTYSEIVHNVNEFDLFISKHTNPQLAFACAVEMNAIADKNGKGKFEVDLIWDFKKRGNADSKNTRDIVRRAYNSEWDYDGVIFKNVVDSGNGTKIKADDLYVAFNSNQIKSTANTEPTTDPDIRYSERASNQELASMDETALYIKNTKKANYIGMIFNGTKTEETRSQRTLDAFVGKDFYVTDGKYVYGSIVLGEPHKYTEAEFHKLENQKKHRVPKGDEYDVKPGGIKWAYPIESYKKFDKPKKLSDSKEYKNSFQAREILYSERVTDKETLDFLNEQLENGEVTKVYRAMQAQPIDENGNVIKAAVLRVVSYSPLKVEAKTFGKHSKIAVYPAKLFSPMAGMVNGKWSNSISLNKWEETTFDLAHATTVTDKKTGKPKIDNDKKNASYGETAYFYGLVKGGIDDSGKKLTDIPARYNPYIHTSLSALNDQFSSANKRPELVTVECLIPNSELTSGFRAEGAKDKVGAMSWHSGPTSSRLAKVGKARTVILTRYDMPVRVLPDSEVAKAVADYIGDTKNIAIQESTVTPSLSRELMNLGITVLNEEQWAQYNEDFPAKTFGENKNTDIVLQERDPESSTRYILANSLESAAQNDVERRKLAEYKEKIALIEAEEGKLAEIQKRLFTKGEVDPTERKALQFEAKQLSNRINTYDRQLLNLEATTALKNVLNREKALAAKRQKQKDNEALKKYKEKVAETQRELMNRYQDSRKRATESRHKTEMRHKIQKVVSELNQLLLKGSKERNVKLGLQDSVAKALEAINMDTVGADERVAKYNDLIAKAKDPDVIASLTETRDRIAAQGDRLSDKLEAMRKAYAEIRNNSKEYAPYYQQEAQLIETAIEKTIDKVGDTSIRNMTLEQLEAVYDMYKVVLQTIRYANELHNEGKVEELRDNASAMMTELEKIKTLKEERAAIGDLIREFTWNEMTPIYAIRRTGSKTLEKFYWEMIRGQNTYAQDLDEADEFKAAIREKYGHSKWNLNKVYSFELKDGRTFRLTLEHMMSIYAYSKRPQAIDHMSVGGFFFNDKATFRRKGGLLKMIKSNEAGYTVDVEMLNTIKDEMEKVAKGSTKYVDEMQDYLTKMGNKGNEVSRVVWGIDIFKEKIYFPLKSVKDFIFQANQPSQETSLKHDGMTKETKPGASNPIVLESFDDVWAGHVERMSQYHGFVIPIDNMNKLLNYGSWAGTDSISVSTMLRARFGDAVNEYFNQFIKDMNGASSASGAKNPFFSMVGKFKKTAVAASMSVVAQQPTAILRAAAVLDSRYFIGLPEAHLLSTKWSELKRYAPIAIIKDIGGFDAGGGRQVAEWLNSDARRGADKVLGKIDDITMWGAAVGDQVGWCAIWEAVKRETKSKHKDLEVGSEAFLKIAGERFTEVIVLTQVYDSTLSRSGYMRSKHDSVKMLTAFMGEPTVSINMQFDALLQAKRGTITKRKAGRILGATYAATVAASIAASLIYALRDDDEDESYLEKFAEAFGEKLIGDINPLNQLPAVRDIISIFEGWDVERTDMAVFKDIKDAFDGLFSENKSTWRKVEDFAGAVASIFGVPLKNLLRTGREIYNGYNDIFDGIEPKDVDDAFVRGIKGEKKDKGKALYDAIVSGDEARIEVYRSQYEDDDAYMNAVKDAIAKNNPEVTQTASDLINGDFDSYQDMVDELVRLGIDRNVAADAIKSIVSKVKSAAQSEADGDTDAYEEKVAELLGLGYDEQQLYRDIASMDASPSNDEDLAESIFSKDNYVTAVINGDPMAETIKQDLIDAGVENGKTEEEVTKSLNNALNNAYKKEYYNGNMSDYEVDSWMKVMYPDDTDADRYWSAKRWKAQAEHLYDEDYSYSKYDDFYEAILDGDTISMNRFIAECRKYNNYKKDVNKEVASDIASAITSHFKPIYREASPQERAILKRKLLNAYAALGYAKSKRSDLIDKWLED